MMIKKMKDKFSVKQFGFSSRLPVLFSFWLAIAVVGDRSMQSVWISGLVWQPVFTPAIGITMAEA